MTAIERKLDRATRLLREVMASRRGTGKYDFSKKSGFDRDIKAIEAWEAIENRVDIFLNGKSGRPKSKPAPTPKRSDRPMKASDLPPAPTGGSLPRIVRVWWDCPKCGAKPPTAHELGGGPHFEGVRTCGNGCGTWESLKEWQAIYDANLRTLNRLTGARFQCLQMQFRD